MLEQYTINHKKMNKGKKIVEYQSLYDYSLFSKLWPESQPLYCSKEPETDLKIFTYSPCQCTGRKKLLQNHDQLIAVDTPNVVTSAYGNLIEHVIQIHNDNHYKATNKRIDVKIPTAFEKKFLLTYISTVGNIYCNSCSISNVQHNMLCLLVAENNPRNTINHKVVTRAVLMVFELIIDVNNLMHQTALSQMFSKWYFLNIAQGLQIKSILRSININTIAKIDIILWLISCKASMNTKVLLNFKSAIPLDDYYNIHCMMFVQNTKGVSTGDNIIEPFTKMDSDKFGTSVSNLRTQTVRIKTYQDVDSNKGIKKDMATNQDLKKLEEHSLNANIWLPKLCGEACDDKISFMTYVLKCSCLNEALVNLDVAEKYVRNIYDIILCPTFYRILLKDLGKSLFLILLNTAV